MEKYLEIKKGKGYGGRTLKITINRLTFQSNFFFSAFSILHKLDGIPKHLKTLEILKNIVQWIDFLEYLSWNSALKSDIKKKRAKLVIKFKENIRKWVMSEIWRRKAIGDLDSLLEKHISNI